MVNVAALAVTLLGSPTRPTPQRFAIEVPPRCISEGRGAAIHALFNIEYKYSAEGLKRWPDAPRQSREVWQLVCHDGTACVGVRVSVGRIESSGKLGYFDIDRITDAKVVSRSRSVVVISEGLYRTFTLDLAARKITYRESDTDLEGVAEAPCP